MIWLKLALGMQRFPPGMPETKAFSRFDFGRENHNKEMMIEIDASISVVPVSAETHHVRRPVKYLRHQ
jgi:hypothetical protein